VVRRRRLAGAALALVLLVAPRVEAQEATNFTLERLRLANDRSGVVDVEWGGVLPHLGYDVGLWVGAQHEPLVLYNTATGDDVGSLVETRVGGSLMVALGLGGVFQLGLEIPLVFYQDRDSTQPTVSPSELADLSSFGVGDIRLVPKLKLFDGLALQVGVDVPSGRDDYRGGESLLVYPELALSAGPGAVRMALNLGYRMRDEVEFLDQKIEDELTARVGLGYRFGKDGGPPVELGVAVNGATSAKSAFDRDNQNHLEAVGMLSFGLSDSVLGFIGGGAGLNEGFGTPAWRGFVGLRIGTPADGDDDKDGLRNSVDRCPKEAEDRDGYQDTDGCPEADNDLDGVMDTSDRCPEEAEDKDGFEDQDGCPDPDNDHDTVLDSDDACPTEMGIAELKGCPAKDGDGDGVSDHLDKCVDQPEDKDEFQDDDGCPDEDNDADGVVDARDRCPNEAGVVENGGCPDKDRDGDTVVDRLDNCPDEAGAPENAGCKQKQLVAITETGLTIVDAVYFRTGKAIIERRSFKLLDNVAAVILAHPEVGVIKVEGHTDDVGKDERNMTLSQERAESVRNYLIGKGVPAERLAAQGFGETQPLVPNTNRKNRATNRRVVFTIDKGEAGGVQNAPAPAPTP
jgi:outer membrane protein OmpA-like peptidoglycan-associated protein